MARSSRRTTSHSSSVPASARQKKQPSCSSALETYSSRHGAHSCRVTPRTLDGGVSGVSRRALSSSRRGSWSRFRRRAAPCYGGRNRLQRLIAKRQLAVHRYTGFWQQMDTFKDKITYDRMAGRGDCPWALWAR